MIYTISRQGLSLKRPDAGAPKPITEKKSGRKAKQGQCHTPEEKEAVLQGVVTCQMLAGSLERQGRIHIQTA